MPRILQLATQSIAKRNHPKVQAIILQTNNKVDVPFLQTIYNYTATTTTTNNMTTTANDNNNNKRQVILFGTSADPPTGLGGHTGIVTHLSSLEGGYDEIRVLPVYQHMFAVRVYI